jgi:outer membrane murein-binding lipoprotein Lpp
MRITNQIITVGALALSLTMMAGMVHSTQFQQAAAVETSGFDALAHDVFAHSSAVVPAAKAPGARGE